MIRDDWLLRQVHELAEALAGVRAAVHDRVDLDAADGSLDAIARQVLGLSLTTLDRLPLPALVATVDAAEAPKRAVLVGLFEVGAELAEAHGQGPLAARRRERAEALRAAFPSA